MRPENQSSTKSNSTSTAITPHRASPQRAGFAAAPAGDRRTEIEARILDIMKGFEKVDEAKVILLAFHGRSGLLSVLRLSPAAQGDVDVQRARSRQSGRGRGRHG